MKTIKSFFMMGALLISIGLPALAQNRAKAAQPETPDALVAALYRQHQKGPSPFSQTTNRALLDKYFDKKLADLIWKDAVTSKGEVGALDGDPLYNAQDTDIKKFSIHAPKYMDGKAEVAVSFENFGNKEEFVFQLVKKTDWKIEDIKYTNGTTLSGFFSEAASGNDQSGFFEGTYKVGTTTCSVKPVKMAFEVRWAKGSGVMMFFFDSQSGDAKPTYTSEDKGAGTDKFVFDNDQFKTGKFIRADGKELPVEKVQ